MHAIIALVLALAALTGCASRPATVPKNCVVPRNPHGWTIRGSIPDARYVAAVGYGPDRDRPRKVRSALSRVRRMSPAKPW